MILAPCEQSSVPIGEWQAEDKKQLMHEAAGMLIGDAIGLPLMPQRPWGLKVGREAQKKTREIPAETEKAKKAAKRRGEDAAAAAADVLRCTVKLPLPSAEECAAVLAPAPAVPQPPAPPPMPREPPSNPPPPPSAPAPPSAKGDSARMMAMAPSERSAVQRMMAICEVRLCRSSLRACPQP